MIAAKLVRANAGVVAFRCMPLCRAFTGRGAASSLLSCSRNAPMQVSVRRMGILDSIKNYTEKKAEEKKEQGFTSMVDTMLKAEKWTLRNWKTIMDEQGNSWMQYIPGVSSNPQVQELNKLKDILKNLTPAELDDPELVNGPVKERIAKQTNLELMAVNRVIAQFQESRLIHSWLHLKHKNKERLPIDQTEMKSMTMSDGRIRSLATKIMGKPSSRRRI